MWQGVHHLGDPWRGSVWEEAIINCPKHIQVLWVMDGTTSCTGCLWESCTGCLCEVFWEGGEGYFQAVV